MTRGQRIEGVDIDIQLYPKKEDLEGTVSYDARDSIDIGKAFVNMSHAYTHIPDYIFIVPWVVRGGADKVMINYINALLKVHPTWHIAVITTLPEENTWACQLPKRVDLYNVGEMTRYLSEGGVDALLTLLITQYVTTTGKKDNILSFTYQNQKINQTVSLNIKCADFKYLEYHSGAVDGTVVNPSIVKFIPRDLYGNVYTDLFDEKLYPKEKLEKLTQGVSVEGHPLTTNNYVDGQFLNVQ